MASGSGSTLILHPDGLDDITFDLTAAAARSGGGYVVSLDALRLNEAKRLEITYSEGPNLEGGEAISSSNPLVPVTFPVLVYGTTTAAMIQKAGALLQAVTNPKGGTLEYKPEDLGGSVRSTFYHYEQSPPPEPRERWDRGPHDSGLYRMRVEVELQTQPLATSDPDNPVGVKSATTVYNKDDGTVGHVAIAAADVKGTEPALTQLRIRNMTSGTWAAIEKLWYARRSEGVLTNFSPVLEGGTPDTDSTVHWTTENDITRRSDTFQRYAPPEAANDLWASLYYTISNITDHEGKAAVAVVCRSLAEGREDWDLKAALQVADVIVETGVKNVATVGMWTVCILGELDIPPTPISDDESYATKLYLYLRRNTGDEDSAIDVDFVQLLYVDEYPQQVTIADGFTSDYKLLLENYDKELCHVVGQSSLALDRVAEPLCPLLKLRAGVDNRIDFIWERLGGIHEVLDDDFEDYEAWRWWKVASFETTEDWEYAGGDANDSTTYYVEGSQSAYVNSTTPAGEDVMSLDIDLTDFSNGDSIRISLYVEDWANMDSDGYLQIAFFQGDVEYFYYQWAKTALANGWNFKSISRGGFSSVGSPSWEGIDKLEITIDGGTSPGGNTRIYCDNWRIVRVDPNETGGIWDFVGALNFIWQICELDSTDHALGCLDITAGVENLAVIDEEPPANIKFLGSVRAKRDNGEVGLVFRCEDSSSGDEDMGAFFIDTTNDQLELRQWTSGTAADIATAVSQSLAVDTDYWLGVWLTEDRICCYFGTTKAAIWDDENKEFLASARKFNVTDSDFASGGALAGGQCGLLSIGTLGRFDDVELYAMGDGHVPGDTIQVEVNAIYRTIYPFRE